jgi:hypothetical protein
VTGSYERQLTEGKVIRRNYSDHPKGMKRTRKPVLSIWPAGKVANAGRMGAVR